jgi:hypothetical protein
MGFCLEEHVCIDDGFEYRKYPIFVGPFKTRQEAEEKAKHQQPQNGGEIVVVREPASGKGSPKPRKRTSRKRPNLRDNRRK